MIECTFANCRKASEPVDVAMIFGYLESVELAV